jgi:heat shock protein HtpX
MNGLKTAVLLAVMGGLLVAIGGVIGGQSGLVIALGIAIVMNVGSYWFSDRLVLRMHKAQAVGPDHALYRVTQRLAQRANLPMPKVYVIPSAAPNAFATGRNPQHAAVAATEGLLRLLSDSEIEGVMAHELAHVKHRDILISTIAATIGTTIMFLVHAAQFAAIFGGGRSDDRGGANPIALIATILLAPLAAGLIQAAISRQREFVADRGGAEIAGSPMGLATALRRIDAAARQIPMHTSPAMAHMYIVKPFLGGGWSRLFSTHPPTEQRIQALMDLRMGRA